MSLDWNGGKWETLGNVKNKKGQTTHDEVRQSDE